MFRNTSSLLSFVDADSPVCFGSVFVQVVEQFLEGAGFREFDRSFVEIKGSSGILYAVVHILLHIPLQHIIGQEAEGNMPHPILVVQFHRINHPIRWHKQIHREKILPKPMT